MKDETDFFTLQTRFKEIKSFYPGANLKYIHVKTVDNFLSHSDIFFMKEHKQQIFKLLTDYFDVIESRQIDTVSKSLELFSRYIKPLANLFSESRGFHMVMRPWIILLWLLPIFILLYFLNASIYFYAPVVALATLFFARQVYFTRQNKPWGFLH
jgi:hypothetical protein